MKNLLLAIEKLHSFEVTKVTVNRLAHRVLLDAANHIGIQSTLSMIVLLSKAAEL
jgi:hypothetical protein